MSKRAAENQLTQDNFEDDGEEGDEDGEFKKAAPEEIAKRRIVKARRGGSAAAPSPAEPVDKPAQPADAAPFSWSAAPTAVSGTEKKEGQEEEEKEGKEDKMHSGGAVAANEDGKKESPATDKAAESPAAENKPLFSFSAFGSGGGFGSGTSPAFSFSSAGTPAGGTAKPFSFGSSLGTGGFGFGTGGMASFSSVGTQGWNTGGSKNGDKDDGDAGNEGEGEDDAESEVAVRKGDGVVQLEEVETCTGEENERCVFQVRAKLFTFGKPATEGKDDGDKKESEKEKAGAGCWNVAGIGNLKLNVPKADDHPGARPRIVMRRQKTFQVCLNTYLFETMLCDKAGPKDVRFTGMKSDGDTSGETLATYLLRVKDEEQADEFVTMVQKYKAGEK